MSLAQYNSIVLALYNAGESIQGIMNKINEPGITQDYICATVQMVYGKDGEQRLRDRVYKAPEVVPAKASEKPKKHADNTDKLVKILVKRSDAALKKLTDILKSDEAFLKKDRARFTLALIYDADYRATWMQAHDVSEQAVIEKLTELGKEKCARPITKKEHEAYERARKVYVKALGNEEKERGKRVTPLYAREVKVKKG